MDYPRIWDSSSDYMLLDGPKNVSLMPADVVEAAYAAIREGK